MTNPTTTDTLAALGLADDDAIASAGEFRVVMATVTQAGADVARLAVRTPDGVGYEAVMPVTEWYAHRRWALGESYQLLQLAAAPRPVLSAVRSELVESILTGISPEVRSGAVRVMGVARAPGIRTKLAVAATEAGVDPIASCVGRGANRVRYLAEALLGERVDVVAWHPDTETYLRNALAPAGVVAVTIRGETAEAMVPTHQMSAAVGGGGLNSALAGRLVGLSVSIVPAG